MLTEARVLLPGAQAMLGFQFVTVLTAGFEKLPRSAQVLHLACLGLIAFAVVLLMAPAAYHRVAEQGRNTRHMYRFASGMVIAALVPLALGLSGDFYVVLRKATGSGRVAAWGAAALLAIILSLWFGLTLATRWMRRGREQAGQRHPSPA